jgi:hypothetical protein
LPLGGWLRGFVSAPFLHLFELFLLNLFELFELAISERALIQSTIKCHGFVLRNIRLLIVWSRIFNWGSEVILAIILGFLMLVIRDNFLLIFVTRGGALILLLMVILVKLLFKVIGRLLLHLAHLLFEIPLLIMDLGLHHSIVLLQWIERCVVVFGLILVQEPG